MKAAKVELIKKYGRYCMLCRRKLKSEDCTYHHIIPKQNGGDCTEQNGAILCIQCHRIIHIFHYGEEAYMKLTEVLLKNKGA